MLILNLMPAKCIKKIGYLPLCYITFSLGKHLEKDDTNCFIYPAVQVRCCCLLHFIMGLTFSMDDMSGVQAGQFRTCTLFCSEATLS